MFHTQLHLNKTVCFTLSRTSTRHFVSHSATPQQDSLFHTQLHLNKTFCFTLGHTSTRQFVPHSATSQQDILFHTRPHLSKTFCFTLGHTSTRQFVSHSATSQQDSLFHTRPHLNKNLSIKGTPICPSDARRFHFSFLCRELGSSWANVLERPDTFYVQQLHANHIGRHCLRRVVRAPFTLSCCSSQASVFHATGKHWWKSETRKTLEIRNSVKIKTER